MDQFVSRLEAASSEQERRAIVAKFSQVPHDHESAVEAMFNLVDAYGSAPDGGVKQHILASILHILQRVKSSSFSNEMTAEEYLTLCMFLNELSSISDPSLFRTYCAVSKEVFQHSVALLIRTEGTAGDAEEEEARESLKSELRAAQDIMATRITTTAAELQAPRMCLYALDALFGTSLAFHEGHVAKHTSAPPPPSLAQFSRERVRAVSSGLMSPLHLALQEQIQQALASGKASLLQAQSHKLKGCVSGSPMLVNAVLSRLEHLLWLSVDAAASSGSRPSVFDAALKELLNDLVGFFQKYMASQQTTSVDTAAAAAANSAAGDNDRGFTDIFRTATVQKAVQRLMSVVLRIPSASLPSAAIHKAAEAIAASFGGPAAVTNPFDRDEVTASDSGDADSWDATAGVRSVPPVLLRAPDAASGDGAEASLAEGMGGDQFKLSFGSYTAAELTEIVMLSLSRMGTDNFLENLRQSHARGLQHMQYMAAKRAQREEVERLRRVEREGVENIPAGRLLQYVQDSHTIQNKGMETLRRSTTRAKLQRSSLSSMLSSYPKFREESEGRIGEVQALIARAVAQLSPLLFDSAVDELLLSLQRELTEAQSARKDRATIVAEGCTFYQLVLQVLFAAFAAQAPTRERAEFLSMDLYTSGAADDRGQILKSTPELAIDTANPTLFFQEENIKKRCNGSGVKRDRGGGLGDDDQEDFAFYDDTVRKPCIYSHLLCRLIAMLLAADAKAVLDHLLSQAPALTRYVWYFLYRHFGHAADERRCELGLVLVYRIAVKRVAYRSCAVNLLLSLCMSRREYTRRLAIKLIGKLLESRAEGGGDVPLISKDSRERLILYAKNQLVAIPGYTRAHVLASAPAAKRQRIEAELDASTEDGQEQQKQQQAENLLVLNEMKEFLNRQLGIFLKLCVQHTQELLPSLLDIYVRCVELDNTDMTLLIPRHEDVRGMLQHLVRLNDLQCTMTVLTLLHKYANDATLLVQSMLGALGDELRQMARSKDSAESKGAQDNIAKVATIVLSNAKAMYEDSLIPIKDDAEDHQKAASSSPSPAGAPPQSPSSPSSVLHDVRFMAPFLSYLSTAELQSTYLPAFLYFIQAQLQFQSNYKSVAQGGLSAKMASLVLSPTALDTLIKELIHQVVVACPVKWSDGTPRGMSPVQLLVYLHTVQNQKRRRTADKGKGASRRTILASDEPELPPIGAVTVKRVVEHCFKLTRTFDSTTVERLYGPEDVKNACRQVMRMKPIPRQLMATVLVATAQFAYLRSSDFIQFALNEVLAPLMRDSVWNTDAELWKGVLVFVELHYRECSKLFVNLPDQVLKQALSERKQLCALFKEEHANNAAFVHILGNL